MDEKPSNKRRSKEIITTETTLRILSPDVIENTSSGGMANSVDSLQASTTVMKLSQPSNSTTTCSIVPSQALGLTVASTMSQSQSPDATVTSRTALSQATEPTITPHNALSQQLDHTVTPSVSLTQSSDLTATPFLSLSQSSDPDVTPNLAPSQSSDSNVNPKHTLPQSLDSVVSVHDSLPQPKGPAITAQTVIVSQTVEPAVTLGELQEGSVEQVVVLIQQDQEEITTLQEVCTSELGPCEQVASELDTGQLSVSELGSGEEVIQHLQIIIDVSGRHILMSSGSDGLLQHTASKQNLDDTTPLLSQIRKDAALQQVVSVDVMPCVAVHCFLHVN